MNSISKFLRVTGLLAGWGVVAVLRQSLGAAEIPLRAPAPVSEIRHSPAQPRSGQAVVVTARISDPASAQTVVVQYQVVEPGHYVAKSDPAFRTQWVELALRDDGTAGDAVARDGVFSGEIPATVQVHRRLIRYRLAGQKTAGGTWNIPAPDEVVPNLAYYVYDGVPGWKGAIHPAGRDAKQTSVLEFTPEAMQRVQVYQLIAKEADVKKATWYEPEGDKDYRYTGTLVVDGQAYDHVGFRARGGVWRHAMGKNMWKVNFNRGQSLRAKDDYGRPYPAKWSKLNLRACIQQGDYGARGEQGMFEAVGFRLFNLAGTEAPFTHWVHWRMVTGETETPANQYDGDFWGLYLAIENEDGSFVKDHALPDGNVYKMMGFQGELAHQGAGAVTNSADIRRLLSGFQSSRSPAWWSTNVSLDRYYAYRSILEAIHHYDVDSGKNYTFYFHPETRRAQVVPWDIDLTWGDQMYGAGQEPMLESILSRPAFRRDYQNRLREIRDLLFNTEETGRLIDECAALIWDPSGKPSFVEADRRKWDYHPIMNSRYVLADKAGKGKFYQASPTRDFAGMVQLMKRWVESRSSWIDAELLKDAAGPATPKLELVPPAEGAAVTATPDSTSTPMLRCSGYQGAAGFAAQQWRLAELAPPRYEGNRPVAPGRYEITPVWTSAEQSTFSATQSLPAGLIRPGSHYRARVRVRDVAGRWSHWSAPVHLGARP